MYRTPAEQELDKQMNILKKDCDYLESVTKSLSDRYQPTASEGPLQDYNNAIAFESFFARRAINKAEKKTAIDLIKAIKKNDMITFNRAIHFGKPDLTYRDASGRSLLDHAIEYNNPVAVNVLLRAQVNPNDYHPAIGLPVLNAIDTSKVYHGEYLCASLLINSSTIYKQNDKGEHAVMKLIRLNMKDLIEDLWQYQLKEAPLTNEGENMLMYASRVSSHNIIEELLKKDFDLRDKNAKQQTVLHILASRKNTEEFIKKVLEKDVDIHAVDIYGNTALHYVAQHAQPESIRLLLTAGAYALAENYKQETPSDKLAQTNSSNHKAIALASTILSAATNKAYRDLLAQNQGGQPPHNPHHIASQKPLFDLTGKSGQHQPE